MITKYDLENLDSQVLEYNNHPFLLISGYSNSINKHIYIWTTYYNDYVISMNGICNINNLEDSLKEFTLISESIRFN